MRRDTPGQRFLFPGVDPQPHSNPIPNVRTKPKPRRRELSPTQEARFCRWYGAYPRHVARAAAERAWLGIEPEPDDAFTDRMILAVQRQGLKLRDWEKIPYPANWLNGKRWDDEVVAPNSEDGPHRYQRPQSNIDSARQYLEELTAERERKQNARST